MKLSLRVAILAGTLASLTLAAHAQSPVAKATVPFEFAAGGAMLPPGDYTITLADVSGVILLQGSSGSAIALFTNFAGAPVRSTTQLVFERRAGMPYLSAVEWPDQTMRLISPFKAVTKGMATAALH